MFYEYAIDPEILSDVSRCHAFFESFRNRSSRLIADVPRNWQQDVFHAINQLPHETCKPVYKKTLKENLKKLLRVNLNRNRGASSNTDNLLWKDFAVNENRDFPFAAIIAADSEVEPVQMYGFESLLFEYPECWNSNDQQHVERKAAAIVDAMAPLLFVSKSIRLVDPHFSFIRPTWDRYEPVLKELVSRLGQFYFGKGISSVAIHTSDKKGSMSQQLEDKTKRWLPSGIIIEVYHWPEDVMHDRFLLTDIGGLYLGHGLDEFAEGKAERVLVSVLENASYRTELAKVTGTSLYSYSSVI
jgi:hypothetical protein